MGEAERQMDVRTNNLLKSIKYGRELCETN